jgi:hypothetical protein
MTPDGTTVSGIHAATLSVDDIPGRIGGRRRFVLDCPHGTTMAEHLAGPELGDDAIVRVIAVRHEFAEGCGCAAPLLAKSPRRGDA